MHNINSDNISLIQINQKVNSPRKVRFWWHLSDLLNHFKARTEEYRIKHLLKPIQYFLQELIAEHTLDQNGIKLFKNIPKT